MERYAITGQMRAPIPPMRVSSLNSSRTISSVGGRSSEGSSMRSSARSAVSFESAPRTSQESSKPRLSKDQQEFLERQFSQHQKPNTQTKKNFANELNVPLEKINNWFQNRRAKSKQDAKKKQHVFTHGQFMHPSLVNGQHSIDQSYVDQTFYQNHHPQPPFYGSWQPPMLPTNSVEPSVNTTDAQFGLDLEATNCMPNATIPESMMGGTMINDDPNARDFNHFFGFANPENPNDSHAMDIYQRQFWYNESLGSMQPIPEYDIPDNSLHGSHIHSASGDSLSRQNTMGSESLSNTIPYPPRNGDLPMPPPPDFFHPSDVPNETYGLPTWGQSAGRPLDVEQGLAQETPITSSEAHLPYRPLDQAYQPDFALYQSPTKGATFSNRAQVRSANHAERPEAPGLPRKRDFDNASGGASESSQPRDSTMARLVESIEDVNVQPHAIAKRPSQQSIGQISLAQRRHRKLTPLGNPVKSTSFSGATPGSPKAMQSHSSERDLRRIKSSIGVMTGRVQKSSAAGSAQRSPLSFTFSEAAASYKASKPMSSRSMTSLSVDTVSRSNSLVPVTPVSPPDEYMQQMHYGGIDKPHNIVTDFVSQPDDSVWDNMPNTSDTANESILSSYVPQHSDWIDFHSPPGTPLPNSQISNPHFFNPFSPPAGDSGGGAESRSEAASLTPQPVPQVLQSPLRSDQSRQSGLNMFHVGDPDLRNLEPGDTLPNFIQPTTTPPRIPQELVIQQFSPRDPVPSDRMPPRTRPNEMPKSFEFQMCGPESFSSPPA